MTGDQPQPDLDRIMEALYAPGPRLQIQVGEDGRPLCPSCSEPMERIAGSDDLWQCPEEAARVDALRAGIKRAVERVLGPDPGDRTPEPGSR